MTLPAPGRGLAARPLLAGMALLCALALGAALVTQHVFNMQPCPWCVLQRLIFVGIGVVSLLAALTRAPAAQRVGSVLALLLGVAGVATALWHHFVAASAASCDLTLADRIMSATGLDMALPEVFAPFASCADAKVRLLGVPYEFYSLALFALLAAAAAWLLRRSR